jgi:hypothetical protein
MNIKFFSTALPRGFCVNRKMGPDTSYFPVFFYFRRWKKEKERENSTVGGGVGENTQKLNSKQIMFYLFP